MVYQPNKFKYRTKKRSVHTLFATTQQPHSTDIFTAQKCLPLAKLITVQEGILAHKVKNSKYLLSNLLTDRHVDRHNQCRNDVDLRIPLNTTTHAHLFIRYRAI